MAGDAWRFGGAPSGLLWASATVALTSIGCERLGFLARDDGAGGRGPPGQTSRTCAQLGTDRRYNALGTGTDADPFLLCEPQQLLALSDHPEAFGKSFLLGADLDLAGYDETTTPAFRPIGDQARPFFGVFDGAGHAIRNGVQDRAMNPGVAGGLFGWVVGAGAEIRNLRLFDFDISADGPSAALVAHLEAGTLLNCGATGSVYAYGEAGGLVGVLRHGVVSSSWAAVTVEANFQNAGGLVGAIPFLSGGWVLNSYATGEVRATVKAGGLIGSFESRGWLAHSYATGAVTTSQGRGGGLIGSMFNDVTIVGVFATGVVTGTDPTDTLGQLVGCAGHATCFPGAPNLEGAWTYSGAPCVNLEPGGSCHGALAGEDSITDPVDFTAPNAAPLQGFDFQRMWRAELGGPPTLAPQLFSLAAFGSCADHLGAAPFAYGDGTPEIPFILCTPAQLVAWAEDPTTWRGYNFRLGQDLDLAGSPMTSFPIGGTAGVDALFDGGGHHIDRLILDVSSATHFGLFGTFRGTLKRLALTNVDLRGGQYGGAVAGALSGLISDCYATGRIEGENVGGLAGDAYPSIRHSHSTVTLVGSNSAGGITASPSVSGLTLEGCVAASPIDAPAGGPIAATTSTLSRSYFDANIPCTGCDNTAGEAVDTTTDPDYFSDPTNPPFDRWDFERLWQAQPAGLPTLR